MTTERANVAWSEREREVLSLIADGKTNAEIAESLGLSFWTAKWHVSEVMSKLGVGSRDEAGAYWRREQSASVRAARALRRWAFAPVLVKVAAGTVASGVIAVGAITAAFGFSGGGDEGTFAASAGGSPTATATAQPTPTPTAVVPVQRFGTSVSLRPCDPAAPVGSCDRALYPELAQFAHGPSCDYSGADFTSRTRYPTDPINELYISYIDLRGCDFSGATLGNVNLIDADLTGANLEGVTATINASGVRFDRANLRGMRLRGVVPGGSFAGADLAGADVELIQADMASWRGATCPDGREADANGGTCVGAGVVLIDPRMGAAPTPSAGCPTGFVNGQVGTAVCPRSAFAALANVTTADVCELAGADLRGAVLDYADLRGCDLAGANLSGASLFGTWFDDANLANANLRTAKLAGARFTRTDVRGANLGGAFLGQTAFDGANLLGATLAGASTGSRWWNTTCPDGTNSNADDGDGQTCDGNR